MIRSIFATILLSSGPTWGLNLVVERSDVQELDKAGEDWRFPEELKAFVSFPTSQPDQIYRGSASKAITVMQRQYAVLAATDSTYSVLSSTGAAPCTMVVLATDDGAAVAHSHMDSYTNTTQSLELMMADLRKHSNAAVTVTLAGEFSDAKLLKRVVNSLRDLGLRNIRFFRSSSLTVDGTGKIFLNAVYSDNIKPFQQRLDELVEDFNKTKKQTEDLIASGACSTEECYQQKLFYPLRKLYASEVPAASTPPTPQIPNHSAR